MPVFLCDKLSKSNGKPKFNNAKTFLTNSEVNNEATTHVVEFSVMNTVTNTDIVIPTFTLALKKDSKRKQNFQVRAMYDPASQISFITEKLAQSIKCAVVKPNVQLKISGFNSSQIFSSRIVEIQSMIHDELRTFRAFVVPEIKTKIPDLSKVKEEFDKNNIELADKLIGREADDGSISILLGVDYASILPIQSASFGSGTKSLLYYCGLGVMIGGNIETLLGNCRYLGSFADFIKKIKSSF